MEIFKIQTKRGRRSDDFWEYSKAHRTPKEAYLEEELDKIIGVGDGGELISPFIDDIIQAEYPDKFQRSNMPHYDETIDPKVFLSHLQYAR